jgi:hypothetical protein
VRPESRDSSRRLVSHRGLSDWLVDTESPYTSDESFIMHWPQWTIEEAAGPREYWCYDGVTESTEGSGMSRA